MSDNHLTADMVRVLAGPELRPAELGTTAAHLALCSVCREFLGRLPEELGAILRQRLTTSDPAKRFSAIQYGSICQRIVLRHEVEARQVDAERDAAPRLLEELESFPVARRRLIAANLERFRSWALCELLIEGVRNSWTSDPELAEVRGVIACDVAGSLQSSGFRELLLNDLRAEAWSCVANTLRIRGQFEKAEDAFEMAEKLLEKGTGEIIERAQVLDLRVSLWREMGRFDLAMAALDEVIASRRSLGDSHLVGRGLISKSLLLEKQERLEEAVALLLEAASLIDFTRDPQLELNRRRNLISNLLVLGRVAEAQALLAPFKTLTREFGSRLERLRGLRIEGQVLYASGQKALGEELLKSVQESFLSVGVAHEAASVSIDLVGIYLEQGRIREVQELTERIKNYAYLSINDAEREAVSALVGLPHPSEEEVLRALLADVAQRLRLLPARQSLVEGDL